MVTPSSESPSFAVFQSIIQNQGLDQLACPSIVVGGTNGKGASVQLLQSIYEAASYRVATFTSPHLFSLTERFQFEGQTIDDRVLFDLLALHQPIISAKHFNYFQALTYIFLAWLKTLSADLVILEVGLGGRLDPVNVIIPTATLITNVSLDHWQVLGDTREAIAAEKAGLIHPNSLCVYGEPDVPDAIVAQLVQTQTRAYFAVKNFNMIEGNWYYQNDPCYLNLAADKHLPETLSNVLMLVHLLQRQLPVNLVAIQKAVQMQLCLGRGTYCAGPPHYYFDVAHNVAAIHLLMNRLEQLPKSGRLIAFGGCYQDKLSVGLFRPLHNRFDAYFFVDLGVRFGVPAPDLLQTCVAKAGITTGQFFSDLECAWQALQTAIQADDTVVVFGSFQTVSRGLRFKMEK